MNCEDVPMSEWDKLTGAEEEFLRQSIESDQNIAFVRDMMRFTLGEEEARKFMRPRA